MFSTPSDDDARPRRGVVFLLAGVVTATGLAAALYLGAWAFDVRRFGTHEGRLARMFAQKPVRSQIEQAFADEGTKLLGTSEGPAGLQDLAYRFADPAAARVLEAGRGSARAQAYRAGDMIYFIFFDGSDSMRAFALVSG